MAGYGFRLYEVKLVAGWGKSKAIPFNACGCDRKQHVGAWMRRVFDTLESYGPLTKMPQQRVGDGDSLPPISAHADPGEQNDPRVDFSKHTASPATRIRFEFNYGKVGQTPFAIGDTPGSYTDLRDKAAGHTYRGLLYLPATGDKGVLALETIPSNAHPVEALNAWLARAAVDVAAEDQAGIDLLPPEQQEALHATPFKLNFNQVVNYERLEKMIKSAADVELVLRKTTVDGNGKRSKEKFRLTSKIETNAERNKAVQVAKDLFKKVVGDGDGDGNTAGMVELADLAPGDVGGLPFNDGYIKVDDGKSGSKKIGVDTVDKYFEYPVGSTTQLDAEKWEQKVAAEVVSLQTLLKADLDVS